MPHFAQIDDNNVVTQVIVVSNDDTSDISGTLSDSIGVAFCQKLVGGDTNWKQTSYNNFRGNHAGIGMTYMEGVRTLGVASTDVFIDQQPYSSWTIGVGTAQWYPPDNPGPAPTQSESDMLAGKYYEWNESNYQSNPSTAWVLITL